MCGLVGAAGNVFLEEKRAVQMMLNLDTIRGKDSAGLGMIERKENAEQDRFWLPKTVGHPFEMFATWDMFDKDWDIAVPVKALIGHNRAATVGKVTEENAHPFIHGHILGAHNGTLVKGNRGGLADYDGFEVDSEAVIYNINKFGVKETIPKVHGAYALTWYDFHERKMNFITNGERPLFYCFNKMGDTFFWASEDWMLDIALKKRKIERDEIKPFPIDHLFTLDIANPKQGKRLELVDEGELKGYVAPKVTVVSTVPFQNGRNIFTSSTTGGSVFSTGSTASSKGKNKKGKIIPADGWELSALKELQGRTVEFYIDGQYVTPTGLPYLDCRTLEYDDFHIRIYADGNELWDKLAEATLCWEGRVKKAVSVNMDGREHRYIVLDKSTIKTLGGGLQVPAPADTTTYDWQGEKLSVEQMYARTDQGCAWCMGPWIKGEKFYPLDRKEFLCECCGNNPELRGYLTGNDYIPHEHSNKN